MKFMKLVFAAAAAVQAMGAFGSPAVTTPGESMTGLTVLQPVKLKVVVAHENWQKLTGFGDSTAAMRMMTLMMVAGSGMEGMASMNLAAHATMAGHSAATSSSTDDCNVVVTPVDSNPVVGANELKFQVFDGVGAPLHTLKLRATVEMATMNMGVTHPAIVETAPGTYSVSPVFSMQGDWKVAIIGTMGAATVLNRTYVFNAGGGQKWTQPATDVILKAIPQQPLHVGANMLNVTLTTAAGKPIDGTVVKAVVSMVTMDMGTSTSSGVKGTGGKLTTTVNLAMSGKWRVVLQAFQGTKLVAQRPIVLSVP
jgi:hypothetical protein